MILSPHHNPKVNHNQIKTLRPYKPKQKDSLQICLPNLAVIVVSFAQLFATIAFDT